MQQSKECNNTELKYLHIRKYDIPDVAYNAGIEGVVLVGFIIKKDCFVNNIKIITPLSDECDQAVLKVIQSMNDLDYGREPAQLNKKYVDYFYTYDVEFNLKKEKKRRSKK